MKIFAHRGSSLIWPENTLLAFDKAHECGATGFETDLRLSRDEEIILSHDDDLTRIGFSGGRVSTLLVRDICRHSASSPDGKFKDNLITLRTLLTRYPEKDYIFDCKITSRRLMGKLKSLLDALHFHDRIWFLTWSQRADEYVREFFPGTPFFPREKRTRKWGLWSLIGLGGFVEPPHSILSLPPYYLGLPVFVSGQLRAIEAREKQFLGYLVNSRRDYLRCIKTGVRQVLTDRADLISGYLRERPTL